MLIDSNIIIYSVQPEHGRLRDFVKEQNPYVSAVSYVEVLGYHGLTESEKNLFGLFFQEATVLDITQDVILEATLLRQQKRMSLGDSLIAGTALVNDLTLVTRNIADFSWIDALKIINPLD
ncbi:MAG: type II toxin-antitoxin system VapC family toxin [Candidatus Latescibacteria bacterium]|jgi:toxin FitB|nr:type II toxin-antitoxin system VapC family toxin [Candidatus Latescibacterota bacterium]MBT5831211.1 type II toxin-antitoxin system VapC family toxin [Candidatus Latescibacterota bacterium]